MKKSLSLLWLVLLVVSCGKSKGGSGGSSSSSNTSSTVNAATGSVVVSIANLQNIFEDTPFDQEGEPGMRIYRYRPSTNSTSTSVSYCFNFFGITKGNCGSSTTNSINSYYQNLINNGDLMEIGALSAQRVDYRKFTSISSTGIIAYISYYRDRSSPVYKSMLGIDATNKQFYVTNATVKDNTGKSYEAYHVEVYDSYSYDISPDRFTSYIVSPELPILANPLATINSNGQVVNVVTIVGNKQISEINAKTHAPTKDNNGKVLWNNIGNINLR